MNTSKPLIIALLTLAPLLVAGCSEGPRSDAEIADMQLRLAALEGESQIRDKLQSYMAVLSARDWDTYVDYFTEDALLIMSEGNRRGRDDIRERMSSASDRMAAAASGQPVLRRAELLSIIEVRVSANTATAKSRFTFISENAEGSFEVSGSGLYIDEWAVENGEWRIASREVDYDLLRLSPR